MAKDLHYGEESRRKLLAGVDKLADTVTVSYTHLTLPTKA